MSAMTNREPPGEGSTEAMTSAPWQAASDDAAEFVDIRCDNLSQEHINVLEQNRD